MSLTEDKDGAEHQPEGVHVIFDSHGAEMPRDLVRKRWDRRDVRVWSESKSAICRGRRICARKGTREEIFVLLLRLRRLLRGVRGRLVPTSPSFNSCLLPITDASLLRSVPSRLAALVLAISLLCLEWDTVCQKNNPKSDGKHVCRRQRALHAQDL